MNTAELARFFVQLGGWPESDATQRVRRLREMRLLPQGGHGVNAPAIDASHAALVVLALGATDRATDAVHAATECAELVPVQDVDACNNPFGSASFSVALSQALSQPGSEVWGEGPGSIDSVRICRSYPEAVIRVQTVGGSFSNLLYRREGARADMSAGLIRIDAEFSAGLLHQLAIELAGDDSGEWSATA